MGELKPEKMERLKNLVKKAFLEGRLSEDEDKELDKLITLVHLNDKDQEKIKLETLQVG